jgi:type IV pilus assembly protein PilE
MKAFNSMRAHAMAGFTLIELMIVVLIVAMLAAIAFPSYTAQVRKSRRSEAKSALLDLAGREERYMATNGAYTSSAANLGYQGSFPQTVGSGYYSISITSSITGGSGSFTATAPTATTAGVPAQYTLTAVAQSLGGQTKDTSCLAFQVNSQGQQTSYSSTTPSASTVTTGCW